MNNTKRSPENRSTTYRNILVIPGKVGQAFSFDSSIEFGNAVKVPPPSPYSDPYPADQLPLHDALHRAFTALIIEASVFPVAHGVLTLQKQTVPALAIFSKTERDGFAPRV